MDVAAAEQPLETDRRPDVFIVVELGEAASLTLVSLQDSRLLAAPDLPPVLHHQPGVAPLAHQRPAEVGQGNKPTFGRNFRAFHDVRWRRWTTVGRGAW